MSLDHYLSLFSNKRLHEIVIPGSHDAGIFQYGNTGGGKTQSLNIGQQARAGCRWFDIRITGAVVHGHVVHKAFHSTQKPEKKDLRKDGMQYLDPKKTLSTDFGGELDAMLRDAKAFVEANNSEFIIFKISKSSNIGHVYGRCRAVLGVRHFVNGSDSCNLNRFKVEELAGHVITLFSESDCQKIKKGIFDNVDGAFPYHELTKDGKVAYDSARRGLQYSGKYSNTMYRGKNAKVQLKNFKSYLNSSGFDVNAMSVMYWTLTTSINPHSWINSNIGSRNVKQWNKNGVNKLRKTFGNMIYESVAQKMGKRTEYPHNNDFPLYKPNVVMMDFVDEEKCRAVRDLNFITNGIIQDLVAEAKESNNLASSSTHEKLQM